MEYRKSVKGDFKGKIKEERQTTRKAIRIVEETVANYSSELHIKQLITDFNV